MLGINCFFFDISMFPMTIFFETTLVNGAADDAEKS